MEIVLIGALITAFINLLFPVAFRYANGKVSKKKGTKIALINSIICVLLCLGISFLFTQGQDGGKVSANLAPAVLYFFIGRAIIVDKNITEEEQNEKDLKDFQNQRRREVNNLWGESYDNETTSSFDETQSNDKQQESVTYCPNCGMQIFNDEEICPNCGMKKSHAQSQSKGEYGSSEKNSTIVERLYEFKRLQEKGILSQEQYDTLKNELLDNLK